MEESADVDVVEVGSRVTQRAPNVSRLSGDLHHPPNLTMNDYLPAARSGTVQ